MKNTLAILIFSLSLIGTSAQAQTGFIQDTLPYVIIRSEKIYVPFKLQNRNIQILDAATISKIPARNLSELLGLIGGLDVRQRGPNASQADIGIDGGTFDQTLLLVNGFKMSDPQTGHNMMNIPIPIAAIERIEVMKGAAARIYGVNALMGVINIVTKKEPGNSFSMGLNSGSSFQERDSTSGVYANFGLEALGQYQQKNWQHLVALSWDQGNGYRYNTAFKNTKILYTGQGKIAPSTNLEVLAGYIDNKFGANAFYAAPNDKESEETVTNAQLALRAPIKLKPGWTLRPSVHYRKGFDHYVFVKSNPGLFENKHHTQVFDAALDNNVETQWGTFALGLNFRAESISSTNLGDHHRGNYGTFVAYQKQFRKKLLINLGAYLNHNTVFGTKLYPGVDIGYNISDKLKLYANTGLGQRIPTFTDLYYQSPNNLGNDQLQAEQILNYELGLKFKAANFQVNGSGFYRYGQEFIDWTRKDSTQAWKVYNFTNLKTWGINLDANYSKQWINDALLIRLAYTYLDPKITENTDEQQQYWQSQYAINSLKHQIITLISYQLQEHWQITLSNKWLYRLNTVNTTIGRKQDYHLLDIKIGYKKNRIGLALTVNNLVNTKYIETGVVPLPGRWYNLGFKYQM